MPREIELALAFYLKHKLYAMEFSSEHVQVEKDKIYDNLIFWMKREGLQT